VVDSKSVFREVISTSGVAEAGSLVDGAALAAVGVSTLVAVVLVVVPLVPRLGVAVAISVGDGAEDVGDEVVSTAVVTSV